MPASLTVRELITRWAFKGETDKIANFDRAIDATKRTVKIAAGAVAGLAAGIGALVVKTANYGDKIAKASRRVGVSTDTLQALGHAAQLSGTSMDEMILGLRSLARVAFDAAEGSKMAARSFEILGVGVKKQDGSLKNNEELLLETLEALAGVKDLTLRTALAQKVFGRSGTNMLPMLEGGAAGIRKMMKEAKDLGIVLDRDALKASEDFNDEMLRLKTAVLAVGMQFATKLMPHMTAWLEKGKIWVQQNKKLIEQKIPIIIEKIAKAIAWVAKHADTVLWILGALISTKIISGLFGVAKGIGAIASGMIGIVKNSAGAIRGIDKVVSGWGGVSGAVGSLMVKLGILGATAAAAYGLGTMIDKWIGASDKISDAMVKPLRMMSELRVQAYKSTEAYQRVSEQVTMYSDMVAKGVRAITVEGGKRVALTEEAVRSRIGALVDKLDISHEKKAAILENAVLKFSAAVSRAEQMSGKAAAARVATPGVAPMAVPSPAAAGAQTQNVTVQAPITVTVPPGTPATLAERVAEATTAASARSYRRAIGDVRR